MGLGRILSADWARAWLGRAVAVCQGDEAGEPGFLGIGGRGCGAGGGGPDGARALGRRGRQGAVAPLGEHVLKAGEDVGETGLDEGVQRGEDDGEQRARGCRSADALIGFGRGLGWRWDHVSDI